MTLSTIEAEYVAVIYASKRNDMAFIFLRKIWLEIENRFLHYDSQSAIQLAYNPMFHSRRNTYR